jgi:DNA-binding CsgD family transcriptional regulator/MFS family permease
MVLSVSKAYHSIILSLALYFGWLLSFPFHGPVLSAVAQPKEYMGFSMSSIFIFFHALAYLAAGLVLKAEKKWHRLMLFSLGISIGTVALLPFFPDSVWPWAMAVLGISSSLFTVGWSYPYATYIPMGGRLRLMATVIIGANIVVIFFNLLTPYLSPTLLLVLNGLPLWIALLLLILFPAHGGLKSFSPASAGKRTVFPVPLLRIFCLFVVGLYLCSGLMYKIMMPYIAAASPQLIYYRFLPYIAVLLIMWCFGKRLQRYFLIYMGASLLGLAFVSFALVYQSTVGLLITTVLIEAAFACLDLFIWTTLGDLALIYGAPFKFFGFVLAAKLSAILFGGLMGTEVFKILEYPHLYTALFALGAISLIFIVIPWLNERIQKDLYQLLGGDIKQGEETHDQEGASGEDELGQSFFSQAIKLLLPEQKLTPRETEIFALLLKGLPNKEISEQLFISENTLKTHLRNIYPKFGVASKRELLYLVYENKRNFPDQQ